MDHQGSKLSGNAARFSESCGRRHAVRASPVACIPAGCSRCGPRAWESCPARQLRGHLLDLSGHQSGRCQHLMVRASRCGSGRLSTHWPGLTGMDRTCSGAHDIGCNRRDPMGPQRNEHGPVRIGMYRAIAWRNLCSAASCVDARHSGGHTSTSGRDSTIRLWHSRDRGGRYT